ncbi:hypothetical protein SAMN05443999_11460 [Roseovarius azorensis]|uniref:Uncharacterized protein n=1 Tax=Roseovarius azorensis TaxID=1287727 RepID=A0A1H7W6K2_9RHOB|nr:hypothetical protein [Roseovarius azorensis]SEM16709.1 hypothetical protein SAMN05443999_11460 [Roseovarius azorensis]
MGVTEDLADELARDVIKAIEATGNEDLATDIQKVLATSSQTAEEAFLTAFRVRRANIKARALLMEKLRQFKAAQEAKTRD